MADSGIWNILVVDDDREVHVVTEMVLEDLEVNGKKVAFLNAYSGEEAAAILKDRNDIALILLDVVMETENAGLLLVQRIRRELNNPDVRIMLRTGQAGLAPEESVILEYDINDYREKTELDSRKLITSVVAAIRAYKDLVYIRSVNEDLESIVAQRTAALEEANRKLLSTINILKEDHEAGARMQYRLLPRRIMQFGNVEFSRYLLPSMYLSGDFVDYFELRDGLIGFYLADVSGHGTSSAFVTVILKNLVDARVEQYFSSGEELILNPAGFAELLNSELLRDNLGKYLTIFYGVLDTRSGRLNYVNCGHNPLPLLRHPSGEVEFCGTTASPLGMFSGIDFPAESLTINRGDSMVLVSDGILEVISESSMKERKEILRSSLQAEDRTIAGLIDHFGLENIDELPDDITFLKIRWNKDE